MQSTSQNASSSKLTEEINSVRTGPQPEIVVESAPQGEHLCPKKFV